MTKTELRRLDRALEVFAADVLQSIGRKDTRRTSELYVSGLLLEGERKSVEPMAARLSAGDESQSDALRQQLSHAVSQSPWSDDEVRGRLARKVERELPLRAWVVDDTGFPKKGRHSVGVARQYSGTLGRTDNCQVAVALHLAGEAHSCCVAMRLYLPRAWTDDPQRCRRAGVPDDVGFQTKWQLSLAQLDDAIRWGLQKQVVLADAGYGDATHYRDGLAQRGLHYLVGISSNVGVWAPGTEPKPLEPRPGDRQGRPRTRWQAEHAPLSAFELARSRGPKSCRPVTWREGSKGRMRSRFGAVRVRTSHEHWLSRPPGDEQWLLYEWPRGEPAPTKLYLSNLPDDTSLKRLVSYARLRWRCERDYQELKGEIGLDHFEGRSWRGFHHHATLCAVAHAFLVLRQALSPPELPATPDAPGRPAPPSARAAPAHRYLPDVSHGDART